MIKVAICGGIGSGKSVVSSILRELGAKVVIADQVNAELLSDPDYISKVSNIFPAVVHNNTINKKELAKIIYQDEGKRRALMDLAHPLIFRKMLEAYPDEPIVFFEIPLMTEARVAFDRIWYLDAEREMRIGRVVSRDGVDRAYAERILSLQSGECLLRDKADVVIENDGDLASLRERVKALYCSILRQFS